ncbi:hypothetical protein [Streptomyces geranii]|uniref:hypothetical protein n=1 Tax=Streptomyces geranii TaxID=2058923 RepID=UPI0018E57FB5|nr:hypothetical protein [Streptomyces geranii]
MTIAARDPRSTDELRQALVESLMAMIGAPDDIPTAETAATTLHSLDERLTAESSTR